MAAIQAPRGTYDVLPDEAQRRRVLEQHAIALLEAAGYRRIETPAFEATELFSRGVGRRPTSCARRCTRSTTGAVAR
jgi:histidyl-tRNA synthetase